eukprot:11618213-Alexandrium_andersonii.AAC.1
MLKVHWYRVGPAVVHAAAWGSSAAPGVVAGQVPGAVGQDRVLEPRFNVSVVVSHGGEGLRPRPRRSIVGGGLLQLSLPPVGDGRVVDGRLE